MPTVAKPAPKSTSSAKPQGDRPNSGKTVPAARPPDTLMRHLPSAVHLDQGITGTLSILYTISTELNIAYTKGAISLARAFVVLRYLKDRMEAADKAFSAIFEDFQKQKIPALFEQEGVPSVALEEGFRVGVSSAFRASIRPDKKPEAYKWLEENGLESIIVESVNASTLSAALKSMQEEHNLEAPELYFNVAYVPNTSVTKA